MKIRPINMEATWAITICILFADKFVEIMTFEKVHLICLHERLLLFAVSEEMLNSPQCGRCDSYTNFWNYHQ